MELKPKWSWVDTSSRKFAEVLDSILNTEDNLFISGPAGTGKSVLLQVAYEHFKNVLVMGPTGISAASLSSKGIPATTIHSALKIPPVSVFDDIILNQKIVQLIDNVDLVLIDEISMVNASLMDFILKTILNSKNRKTPRIIMFGDIFQLPPVKANKDLILKNYFKEKYNGNYFFFASKRYESMDFVFLDLVEIYRQKDIKFKEVLNRIRLGFCTNEDLDYINTRVVNKNEFLNENKFLLYLATTNKLVKSLNDEYTSRPEFSQRRTYFAEVVGEFGLNSHPHLENRITIAVGQQVMCIGNNPEEGYQNGTIGIVENLSSDFVRIRKLDGTVVYVKHQKYEEYKYFYDTERKKVDFDVVGYCKQIACKPAFAVTFHKCQGLTLDRVFIDLSARFVPDSGIYLALSRCTTLEGIGLSRPITLKDIQVSPEALEFIADNESE